MYKKILVAFDGSENAFKALKRAIDLAKEHQSKLSLATVVNLPGLPTGEPVKKDHLSGKRTPFQRQLEKAAIIAMQEDIPVSTHLLRGQSARALIEFCEKGNHDLVVVGARGNNQQTKAEMGSFAAHVVNNSSCPVMVVKEDEEADAKTRMPGVNLDPI